MVLSQPQKRCLIPLSFLIVEILIMPALEDFIAIRLMILNKLLIEPQGTCLLFVRNLLDLGLIHVDVSEVQVFLC